MDVHVHLFRRQVEKQRQHRMAITRQHVRIGAAHRAREDTILHGPTVDEQVLVIRYAAIERRQAGDAGQPHVAALQIDDHAISG